MISHKYKFIFIPVPKTASTSMLRTLKRNKVGRPFHLQHPKLIDLKRALTEEQFNSYKKFAVIRNPWDWYVSRYLYLRRRKKQRGDSAHVRRETRRAKVLLFRDQVLARPFVLENFYTLGGIYCLDEYLKFETLAIDFNKFGPQIGLSLTGLPKLNVTENRFHYSKYYDEELKNIVLDRHRDFIDKFNYKFEQK